MEIFLSVNFNRDLYTGMQLGGKGQSLMLGGTDRKQHYAVKSVTMHLKLVAFFVVV